MSVNNLIKPFSEEPDEWTNLNVNSIKTQIPLFGIDNGSVSVIHDTNPKTVNINFNNSSSDIPHVCTSIENYSYFTKPVNIYNTNITASDFSAVINVDEFQAKSLQTVLSANNVGAYSSIAVISGRPAIVCRNLPTDVIAYSINAEPDGTGAWSTTTASIQPNINQVLKEVNGVPMVAYFDGTNIRLTVSTDADGLGVWTDNLVYTDVLIWLSFCEIDGGPMIAYCNSNGVYLLKSDAADGSGPWTRYTIELGNFNYVSLNIIDGRPAVSYYIFADDDLKFAISNNLDGTDTWNIQYASSDGGSMTSLQNILGRPAISFSSRITNNLYFTINRDVDGSGPWDLYQLKDSSDLAVQTITTSANGTSLVNISGNPAISFTGIGNSLKYARNTKQDGSGTWDVVVVDDTAVDTGRFSSLVELTNTNPGISYHANTGEDLRYATGTLTEISYDVNWIKLN